VLLTRSLDCERPKRRVLFWLALVRCSPAFMTQRGLHDVRDEIRFPSRPGFVFHDSCGFEAGSVEELASVRKFVEDSSKVTDIRNQLHAIWYELNLVSWKRNWLKRTSGCVSHLTTRESCSRVKWKFSAGRGARVSKGMIWGAVSIIYNSTYSPTRRYLYETRWSGHEGHVTNNFEWVGRPCEPRIQKGSPTQGRG
jgi:hypothetical protein